MALEKELQEAMGEKSEWKGNPDRLWANVAQAISTAESPPGSMSAAVPTAVSDLTPAAADAPTPAPVRHRPWRVPSWAVGAAVVLLAAGTWALRTGTVSPQAAPKVTNPGPLLPGPGHQEQTLTPGIPHRGPLKLPGGAGVGFDIRSAKEGYAPGEPVQLTVRFRNDSADQSIQLEATTPQLRINPASADSDLREPAMAILSLPALAGRKLAPGEVISVDVTWAGSSAAPGWYRAELALVHYEMANKPGSMGGGGTRFFMAYPPGAVKTGIVESGATDTMHDITLTVRKVEFTDRETKVYFHLSNLRAPAEFGLALERPEGAAAFGGVSYKDSPEGGIEGIAQFDPLPAHSSSITVVVPGLSAFDRGQGMEKLTGPWRVTVPLN